MNSTHTNKNICTVIFTSFILFSVLIFLPSSSLAQTTDKDKAIAELQQKITERNQNIEQLNKEIKQYQDLADKTSKEAQSLQKAIKILETNGKALNTDIKKTQTQIDATSLVINKLDLQINQSDGIIKKYKDALANSISQIHQSEDRGIVTMFLSKQSLSDVLNSVDNLLQFNNTLQDIKVKLETENKVIAGNIKDKSDEKQKLVLLQVGLTDKKKVVEYNKSEQSKVLSETKNQEQEYQKLLKDKQALKAAFEKDVFNYESQLKYTFDPSSVPKSNSNALGWPVENVIITQMFGKTSASGRLYVSGSHNGVDFGARIGTPVMSLGTGTVAGSGDTDITCPRASFGRWVLIKYDNGLASTYGHLSVIKATQGQRVNKGDIIGYSGNTGYSTGPHVHISMYAANAVDVQTLPSKSCGGRTYTMPIAATNGYLDPMLYFPAYNK